MEHNEVIDLIITLIKGAKAKEDCIVSSEVTLQGCNYLLGQVIRQIRIPLDHWFVSDGAKTLWEKLTSKNIMEFWYTMPVPCDRANGIKVDLYRGGEKKPYKDQIVKKNGTIIYREVFHDEHIVPVVVIVNELCALKEPTRENVKRILDKIYMCKLLKEEDRRILHRSNRPSDYRAAIVDSYTPQGITIENVVTQERL